MQARQDGKNGLRIARNKSSWHCRFASIRSSLYVSARFSDNSCRKELLGFGAALPEDCWSHAPAFPPLLSRFYLALSAGFGTGKVKNAQSCSYESLISDASLIQRVASLRVAALPGRRELFASQGDRGRIIAERAATRELLHLAQHRPGSHAWFLQGFHKARGSIFLAFTVRRLCRIPSRKSIQTRE